MRRSRLITEKDPDTVTDAEADQVEATAAKLREAGEALQKAGRLMLQVKAAMPQWRDGRGLEKALRRYWPGGRALAG
jgi:hypothetical protein